MSIAIQSQPKLLTFVGNQHAYSLACSPQSAPATAASVSLRLNLMSSQYLPAFTIILDGISLPFVLSSAATAADAYLFSTPSDLVAKLSNNFYLAPLFTASLQDLGATQRVTLSAINPGFVDISVTDVSANLVDYLSVQQGSDTVTPDNYSVLARFELADGTLLPWCRYSPFNGQVSVSTLPLADYFPVPDMPVSAILQQLAIPLKYRLQFAESYGNPAIVQAVATSDWRWLLPGELLAPFASSNIPDWNDIYPSATISHPALRVLGDNHADSLDTRPHQPEYLYLLLPPASPSVTSASLTITVGVYTADSTTPTTSQLSPLSLTSGYLYRLSVGMSALNIPSTASAYTVSLVDGNQPLFSRTFTVRPDFLHQRYFLLENRYGFLVSFVAQHLVRDTSFEADNIIADGIRSIDRRNALESFTATTPAMPRNQAQRFADCLTARHQFFFASGIWQSIAIYPDSFTVDDDAENLVVVSFRFSFAANRRRNIAATRLPKTYPTPDIPDTPVVPD